ncbi:putative lipoprotein signal peptide [Pseudomonas sp. R4-39-08]|uniref:alpha/beta hydrolase family protein n=1 Tax=Pseudomonas sp. R4-39-08 TaxID=1173288 RepID=UPI000F57D54C|nr:alpha/beta fold hydrolase [Pseudomonas sp. R4-39-08]AZF38419.1 putative lipoprotein signal peptide [Pseudomonas sp. R4-39-08]
MKTALAALFLICLTGHAFANDYPVGFKTATLSDAHNLRPLELVVWYPAITEATPRLIRDDMVFYGTLAVPDAPPANGEHPLVVLSHGYRGNWGNQAWLGSALARQGYIVAAVNHPGSTTKDRSPAAAARLWQRPEDLSRAIDSVLAQPKQFGAVAQSRIALVGHSLGAWTVLESAGARFDHARFAKDCGVHPQLSSCSVYQQMNPAGTPAGEAQLAADLSDKRVTAVVSLDIGLSRGFTDASLAALPVPVLVIAAGVPSMELPSQLESADLAKRLPKASTQYVEISDASHFSFMAQCKPGAAAMLDEDAPGDGIICQDGAGGRPRAAIQQQVVTLISKFLAH